MRENLNSFASPLQAGKGTSDFPDDWGWVAKLVFPETEYLPAGFRQRTFDSNIALLISAELRKPVGAVAAGFPAVFGAAVPETPVNEDSKTLGAEYEIRTARKCLVTPPSCDVACAKNCGELQLRVLIAARTDRRHDLGAFGPREDIGHSLPFYRCADRMQLHSNSCSRFFANMKERSSGGCNSIETGKPQEDAFGKMRFQKISTASLRPLLDERSGNVHSGPAMRRGGN